MAILRYLFPIGIICLLEQGLNINNPDREHSLIQVQKIPRPIPIGNKSTRLQALLAPGALPQLWKEKPRKVGA
jgi:hypothetical protein